jgi:hypothetical protein
LERGQPDGARGPGLLEQAQPWTVLAVVTLYGLGTWWSLRDSPILLGDIAIMELKVRAIADGGHWPMTGAYSRMGWDHPGPAQWYYLTGVYLLLGKSTVALSVAAILWQLAMVVVAWWTARRRDALLGWLVLLGGVAALWVLRSSDVALPWNPLVGAVGVLTLVVLGWDCALGGRLGALLMLPLGSFLAQSHLGYVPVVAAVCALALALLLWHRRTAPSPTGGLRWLAAGTGAAVAMWALPVLQQLTHDPGNLELILGWESEEPRFGLRGALGVLSRIFANPSSWRSTPWLDPQMVVPWLLVLPLAATVVAALRRSHGQLAALGLGWAAVVSAWFAVGQIRGEAFAYLAHFVPPTVLSLLAFSLWVLLIGLGPRGKRMVAAVSLVTVVSLAGTTALRVADEPPVMPGARAAAATLADQLTPRYGSGGSPVYLSAQATDQATPVYTAVANLLVQSGSDVSLPGFWARASDPRLDLGEGDRQRLTVVAVPVDEADSAPGGPDVVARYTAPVGESHRQLAEIDARIAELEDLTAGNPAGATADELRLLRFLRVITANEIVGFLVMKE